MRCADQRGNRGDTMTTQTKGIPDGVSRVIPRLFCREPAAEVEFCAGAFGATALNRRESADGQLLHALMAIGSAMIMIEAEWPGHLSRAPTPDGSSPVPIYVYVEDVDRTSERAVAQGAQVLLPATNQFWGDRTAWLMDPSGHVWTVASRIEESSEEERSARWSGQRAR